MDAIPYETRPQRSGSIGAWLAGGILFSSLVVAMLQLLFFQLEPGAPLWRVPAGTSPQQMTAASLGGLDAQLAAAAAGGNLELHLAGFDPTDARQAMMLGALYYRANYTLYPHRAWVGRGDRTINLAADLMAADEVPDDAWLRDHDVNSVLTMIRSTGNSVGEVARVVR